MLVLHPTFTLMLWSWVLLFAVISGIGLAGYRLLGIAQLDRRYALLSFWAGLALATLLLQLWHLLAPVTALTSALLAVVGSVGLWLYRRQVLTLARRIPSYWPVLILWLGLSVWVASRAANAEPFYDDGLYHVPNIAWVLGYPVVPGLGNVHGRLAFNNAYSLPLAAIEAVPFLPEATRLGNSLLLVVFIGQVLLSFDLPASLRRASVGRYFAGLLLIPILARLHYASSAGNDLIVSMLSLIVGAMLLKAAQNPPRTGQDTIRFTTLATLLCCFGIAIKLSFAVYGVMALAIILLLTLRNVPNPVRRVALMWAGVVAVSLLGVWAVRGVILSGYPLYPLTAFGLPVEWRVPEAFARAEANAIYAWARAPFRDANEVLSTQDWLPAWLAGLSEARLDVGIPALLLLAAIGAAAWGRAVRRIALPSRAVLWFAMPAIAALVFWFVSAPDPRFGWQYFWLLGAGVFVLVLGQIDLHGVLRVVTVSLVVLFGFEFLFQMSGPYGQLRFIPFRDDGQLAPPVTTQRLHRYTSYHGAEMWVAEDQFCFMMTPPCAISDLPYLKQRLIGQISGGFVYDEIAPDKGAFDLRAASPAADIGPAAALQALHSGVLPDNGLLVGHGWHALEQAGDELYRWAAHGAEIYVTNPTTAARLILDIEPGPSLGGQPLALRLTDEAGAVVAAATVSAREQVVMPLPLTDERVQVFTLDADSPDVPAPGDGRLLNFRVISFDWADESASR